MLRQSPGISHLEYITKEEVQRCIRVEPSTKILWEWHLQWYAHVVHVDPYTLANVVYTLQVAVKHPHS